MRWSLWLFLGCGAVAGLLVAHMVPAGLRELQVHEQEFRLVRSDVDPVEVTPARWFFLPYLFGDFDLQLELEIGEGAEVDVLLRQVEPRFIDEHKEPFAGRFTTLRLSSEGDGVGWRTREQALFGPTGNGVRLAPGYPATVWIQARGRMLRANVAGKWQPWRRADDRYGMITIIAKGGNAVLGEFLLTPRPQRRWPWSPWLWAGLGLLGASVTAAFALTLGQQRPSFLASGLVLVLLARWLHRSVDADLAWPDPGRMSMALAACLLVALVILLRRANGVVLALLVALAILLGEGALAGLQHDTREVEAVFGPDAGNQISEAHGQRVRGPAGLHDVGGDDPSVFLLGGQLLYDCSLNGRGDLGEHLELLLKSELRGRLGRPVDVPCLPTLDGHARQQWRLFRGFYTGYQPRVVVFGVSRGDAESDPARGFARTTAPDLAETLKAANEWCRANGSELVLFAEAQVWSRLMTVLEASRAGGLPLVVADPDDSPKAVARKLADAIEPMLR